MRTRKVQAFLLVLLGVVLAVAGPVAAGMKVAFAGGGGPGSWSRDAASLGGLMSTRLEDGVAPELTVDLELHRRILAGSISSSALNPYKPACPGQCAAHGRPYTNRGCKQIYQCRGVEQSNNYSSIKRT
ncbi:hypothetical protein EJB05_37236, partial [Eragrostis curvula]